MLPRIEGITREELGSGSSKQTRRRGYIPSVVYNEGQNGFINVPNEDISSILRNHGASPLIELKVGDKISAVLIKEVQRHPISGELLHIDFKPVVEDKIIKAKVPVTFSNTNNLKKEGGIIQTGKNELEVECKAKDVPKNINIDASQFKIGESVKIKDVELSREISIVGNREDVIASFIIARD